MQDLMTFSLFRPISSIMQIPDFFVLDFFYCLFYNRQDAELLFFSFHNLEVLHGL